MAVTGKVLATIGEQKINPPDMDTGKLPQGLIALALILGFPAVGLSMCGVLGLRVPEGRGRSCMCPEGWGVPGIPGLLPPLITNGVPG